MEHFDCSILVEVAASCEWRVLGNAHHALYGACACVVNRDVEATRVYSCSATSPPAAPFVLVP
eukprot:1167002-Alexandrium_andersonii.AAC.1